MNPADSNPESAPLPARQPDPVAIHAISAASRRSRSARWAAMAMTLTAIGAGAVALNVGQASRRLDQVAAERAELLKGLEDVIPGISASDAPLDQVKLVLARETEAKGKVRRAPPVLPEAIRVLAVIRPHAERLHMKQLELQSGVPSRFVLSVPYVDQHDRDLPVDLWETLTRSPGLIAWTSGDWEARPPVDARRDYIFEGRWSSLAPRNGGAR